MAFSLRTFTASGIVLLGTVWHVPAFAEELPGPAAGDAEAARRMIRQAIDGAAGQGTGAEPAPQPAPTAAAGTTDALALARVSAEVAAKQLEAKRLSQRSPADALSLLDATAKEVEGQGLPATTREHLLRRIERTRRDIEETTGKRRAELALEAQNSRIEAEIDRDRARKVEVDQRIAMLVEEYNSLVDQQRFPEAEAIAKKAGELAPDNAVVRQLVAQSRLIRRIDAQQSLATAKQAGFLDVVEDAERSSTPFAGPIEFPATKDWRDLTRVRGELQAAARAQASPAEREIQRRLDSKVAPTYRDQPLSKVLEDLGRQADVAVHLDLAGLDEEHVRSDTPVTLALEQPISLKSALKLILEPLHLGYAVRDEVLKVTSPKSMRGDVYAVTYPVADLVLPVPNFSSDGLGITGALRDGYSQASLRNSLAVQVGPLPEGLNARDRAAGGDVSPAALAQIPGRRSGGPPSTGSIPSIPFGPPTVGGGQADFQSLIDLIQSTVAAQTWDTVGGPGAIKPFDTNLSLVISQTQEVHEEIADLLEQLRRLQDLQVTIE
ncbi:MAG: hypothetical protein ACKOZU_05045, partial [Planctomycetaceae bacterium]